MRKLTFAIIAIALVLGMTQCKKKKDLASDIFEGGTRTITLNVGDNSKVSVNPNTGVVKFTQGDIIYVAYEGKYVGTLTFNGDIFTGDITTGQANGDKKLAFYFMGNRTPDENLEEGVTSTLSVNIYNQTRSYPVISAGLSNEYYSTGSNYSATLNNKCALVKFTVTSNCNTDVPTIITGVNDRVKVTFASGSLGAFENMQEKGAVRLAGGSGERWAILLPSAEGSASSLAYTGDLQYNCTYGPFPALASNDYLSDGFEVNLNNALSGFTIDKNGTKVFFAPGNLQATTTNYGASWSYTFAENQYDVLGKDGGINEKITNPSGNTSANGTIDLFCWVGENSADSLHLHTYGIVNDYDREHYGNVHREYLKSDWGNAVGNVYGRSWYLPKFTKFTYMLGFMQRKSDFPTNATAGGEEIYDHRTSSTVNGVANARFAIGQIQDSYHNKTINGLFIFPDVYTQPAGLPALQHINENPRDTVSLNYNDNNISLAEWTQMEALGCAFLPATGVRDVESDGTLSVIYPQIGGYWQNSSDGIIWKENGNTFTYTYNELKADMMFFGPECVYSNDHYHRSYGFGVRLVTNKE